MTYRHEYKYFVSTADLALLRCRLKHLIRQDVHQKEQSGYLITSLYFDRPDDKCWKETIDGYDLRHKYRLRIYNHSTGSIKLERKSKTRGMTSKKTVSITKEECLDFMNGKIPAIHPDTNPDKAKILCEMKMAGMKPKCIVQYCREVFVYPVGNVRITFDENICGSNKVLTFLDQKIPAIPLLDTDTHVLEVKYDDYFPQFIKNALDIETLMRTSCSKYAYARNTIREYEGIE